jgi:hypothetical protein
MAWRGILTLILTLIILLTLTLTLNYPKNIHETDKIWLEEEFKNEMLRQRDSDRQLMEEGEAERQAEREDRFRNMQKFEEKRRDEQLGLVQEAGEEALINVEERMRVEILDMSKTHEEKLQAALMESKTIAFLERSEGDKVSASKWAIKIEKLESDLKEVTSQLQLVMKGNPFYQS